MRARQASVWMGRLPVPAPSLCFQTRSEAERGVLVQPPGLVPGCKGRGSGAGRLAGLLAVPRAHLFQELHAGLSRFILLLVMELRTAHISSGGGPGLSCGPTVQTPCDNQRQLEPGDAGDSLSDHLHTIVLIGLVGKLRPMAGETRPSPHSKLQRLASGQRWAPCLEPLQVPGRAAHRP